MCAIPSGITGTAVYAPALFVVVAVAFWYVAVLVKTQGLQALFHIRGSLPFDYRVTKWAAGALILIFWLSVASDLLHWTAGRLAAHQLCTVVKQPGTFRTAFMMLALLVFLAVVTALLWSSVVRPRGLSSAVGTTWLALISTEAALVFAALTTSVFMQVWVPIAISLTPLGLRLVRWPYGDPHGSGPDGDADIERGGSGSDP